MGRNIISFELRPVKDDDIDKKLKEMITDGITQSDIVRTALRHYFNLNLHSNLPAPPQNSYRSTPAPQFEPQDTTVELQQIEKDDTQLDAALDDLLNF